MYLTKLIASHWCRINRDGDQSWRGSIVTRGSKVSQGWLVEASASPYIWQWSINTSPDMHQENRPEIGSNNFLHWHFYCRKWRRGKVVYMYVHVYNITQNIGQTQLCIHMYRYRQQTVLLPIYTVTWDKYLHFVNCEVYGRFSVEYVCPCRGMHSEKWSLYV